VDVKRGHEGGDPDAYEAPAGWAARRDPVSRHWSVYWDSGHCRKYYYNRTSGVTTWERPEDVRDDEPPLNLPAAPLAGAGAGVPRGSRQSSANGVSALAGPASGSPGSSARATVRQLSSASRRLGSPDDPGALSAYSPSGRGDDAIGKVLSVLDRSPDSLRSLGRAQPARREPVTGSVKRANGSAARSAGARGSPATPAAESYLAYQRPGLRFASTLIDAQARRGRSAAHSPGSPGGKARGRAPESLYFVASATMQRAWRCAAARRRLSQLRESQLARRRRLGAEHAAALARAREERAAQLDREERRWRESASHEAERRLNDVRRLRLAQLQASIAMRRHQRGVLKVVDGFRAALARARERRRARAITAAENERLRLLVEEAAARVVHAVVKRWWDTRRAEAAERRAELARAAERRDGNGLQFAAASRLQAIVRGRRARSHVVGIRRQRWRMSLRRPAAETLGRLFRFMDERKTGRITRQQWLGLATSVSGPRDDSGPALDSSRDLLSLPFVPRAAALREADAGADRGAAGGGAPILRRSSAAPPTMLRRSGAGRGSAAPAGGALAKSGAAASAPRRHTLSRLEAVRVFETMDDDKSFYVEESEFVAYFTACSPVSEASAWAAGMLEEVLEGELFGLTPEQLTVRSRRRREHAVRGSALAVRAWRQLRRIRRIAELCDKDNGGSVSLKELIDFFKSGPRECALTTDGGLQTRMFRLIDEDGDGELSTDEFIEAVQRLELPEFHEWVDAYFDSLPEQRAALDEVVIAAPPGSSPSAPAPWASRTELQCPGRRPVQVSRARVAPRV